MMKQKKKTYVGDLRINRLTKAVEVCTEVHYNKRDRNHVKWEDEHTIFLHTTAGMSPDNQEIYSLEHFRNTLLANTPLETKKEIKIRYAYFASSTNLKEDPAYYGTLKFKVLPLEIIERKSIYVSIKERISAEEEECIEVLGRDLYLNRVDMDGKEIYERDIIRWFIGEDGYHDEEVDILTHFNERDIASACKVIGTVYDARHVHTL